MKIEKVDLLVNGHRVQNCLQFTLSKKEARECRARARSATVREQRRLLAMEQIRYERYILKCVRRGTISIETAARSTGYTVQYLMAVRLGYRRVRKAVRS
jgi:hypothetical protein